MQIDKRVWKPDGSCLPWVLETSEVGVVNFWIARFRVPQNYYMVIDNIWAICNALLSKSVNSHKLIITRNKIDAAPTTFNQHPLVYTGGALLSIEELRVGGITGNTEGMAIFCNTDFITFVSNLPFDRKAKILLVPGQYNIGLHSTGNRSYQFHANGWMFPYVR